MPIRSLPVQAVKQLRGFVQREIQRKGNLNDAYKFLGRLQNIDPRRSLTIARLAPERSTTGFARKVRQINANRRFPEIPLIIKRTHEGTAKEVIKGIRQAVAEHNRKHKPKTYTLLGPIAYEIGPDLIAMAKTENPNLGEMLSQSKRGAELLRKLNHENGVTYEMIRAAADEAHQNIEIRYRGEKTKAKYANLLVAGFKDGKFIFVALPDLE